jgi:hypothetical protein
MLLEASQMKVLLSVNIAYTTIISAYSINIRFSCEPYHPKEDTIRTHVHENIPEGVQREQGV